MLLGVEMKNTVKIAFCALMSALGAAFMWLSYFPYFTYAVPAIAGLVTLIVFIEIGDKWAWGTFIVTAVLALLFAEPEAKLMYILFLGYYPILKAYIERLKNRVVQYILKFAVFNVAVAVIYGILAKVFGIYMADIETSTTFFLIGLVVLANFTFYLYDIVLVRVANVYLYRLHRKIKKMLKLK